MKRRTKIILALLVVVLIVLVIAGISLRPKEEQLRTATVSRGAVTQDVSFTGRLLPARSADVSFSASGVISNIAIKAGDVVGAGQLLASLDPRTAQLDVAKATADLVSTQEETRITQNKAQAEYTKTKTENAQLIAEQTQRVRDAKAELDQALSTYHTRADDEGEDSFLAKTAYQSYLSARSAYNAAQQTLTTLRKTVDKSNASAKAAADLASAQHISTLQASATNTGLSSLNALAQRSRVALSQYNLIAPFAGIVTRMEAEVGEYASPGNSLITVETSEDLEIKADVTESDATKLSLGLSADITFDAVPDEQFSATVMYIAPSARIVEGVPVYEITLKLHGSHEDLRAGLTSDINVHANKRESVLFIPRRSVVERDGKRYVQIMGSDGLTAEQEVQTGLVGSDGSIEVVSGLSEGQSIVLSVRDGE